ncbi:MAG: sugar transferase [Paracoccus sp. (in: a-proteobacteria)]|nr:sugar transferase [Paracoccus sp. (in: a-proteobacteria)]
MVDYHSEIDPAVPQDLPERAETPLRADLSHRNDWYHRRGKRIFDLVLSAIMLVLLAVPLIIVALLLLLVQGRPIFYLGRRVRAPGQVFAQIKFRTMSRADNDRGATGAHKNWRITPLGRFLRKYRIDELPQLVNILRGEMSFVGPRPPLREYVARFPKEYAEVLQMRPGATGLATLIYHRHEDAIMAGCHSVNETERAYYERCLPTKLRIEQVYLERASLGLDLWIMWRTVMVVIRPRTDRNQRRRPPMRQTPR